MDLTADNLLIWKFLFVVFGFAMILVGGKFVQMFVKEARKTLRLPKSNPQRRKMIIFLVIVFVFFLTVAGLGGYSLVDGLLKYF